MRKALVAVAVLLALTATAGTATAAQLEVRATLDGEPVSGVNVSIMGLDPSGELLETQSEALQGGKAEFEVVEGSYVVSLSLEGVTLRKRVETDANGTFRLEMDAGPSVSGSVTRDGEPVPNASVGLKDFFGTAASGTTDGNGSFSFSPVLEGANYTAEVDYLGYPFEAPVEGEEVSIEVSPPLTSDEGLVYRATSEARIHSGRMTFVDYSSSPPSAMDVLNVFNPHDRPFSGELSFDVPAGAEVRGVEKVVDGNARAVNYRKEIGAVVLNSSVPPGGSGTFQIFYSLTGNSITITAERYTNSTWLLATGGGVSREDLELTGPVEMQGPITMSGGGQALLAIGGDLAPGTEYGMALKSTAGTPGGDSGKGGGISMDDAFIGLVLAVVLVSVLVYFGSGGGAGPLGGLLSSEGRGARCPKCGAEADGEYCPECGAELGRQVEEGICPNCGEAVEPGDRFCSSCGEEL